MFALVRSASKSVADRVERGEMNDETEVREKVLGALHFSFVGHHAPLLK